MKHIPKLLLIIMLLSSTMIFAPNGYSSGLRQDDQGVSGRLEAPQVTPPSYPNKV